eukprot:jgi/Chrzof1/4349/Cz14g09200.t1
MPLSSERVAGIGFFIIVLLQVPCFVLQTHKGSKAVSPLEITAAHLASHLPHLRQFADAVLIPGIWFREGVAAYLRCKYNAGLNAPCSTEVQHLKDVNWIKSRNSLNVVQQLLQAMRSGQAVPITYGCGIIVMSALFSLVHGVKLAVVGVLLLGYGIVSGNHTPLPPAIMMLFLCVYSGFQLGEGGAEQRAAAAAQQRRRLQQQQQQPQRQQQEHKGRNKGA